jgi:hypothetical protein
MEVIVERGCDNEAGMLDMEPPFEKHLFVDCVFAERMFDERLFGPYAGEREFDLSSPI